ncbi:hypothetical protein C7293_28535 [filamentous cyanobacterium CCT1]|nr:hypothetical protein C7293_28535 [filamentous cyanobacterium CCT1]PSN76662.1 hypothetical protein C8B47_26135 [filamentous cyanobacterium CCP4]
MPTFILVVRKTVGDRLHTMPNGATHTFTGGLRDPMTRMADRPTHSLKIFTPGYIAQLITGYIGLWFRLLRQSSPIAVEIYTKIAYSQRRR